MRAAPQHRQQQQQQASGAAAGGTAAVAAGGSVAAAAAAAASTQPAVPPFLLAKGYEILGVIGEGTFGRVYLARHSSQPGRFLALKHMKPPQKEYEGLCATALREVGLLRALSHPHLVSLEGMHMCVPDLALCLVFPYAETDLYEVIRYHRERGTSMLPHVFKSIMLQLLSGVDYLHSNWVLHRDLKPSNILLEQGRLKIADFGLARSVRQPLEPLWRNGVVVTIWYRPPELLLDARHYSGAVDVWAVGCIMAELLMLRPLFQGEERKGGSSDLFQGDQLHKIFCIMGHPSTAAGAADAGGKSDATAAATETGNGDDAGGSSNSSSAGAGGPAWPGVAHLRHWRDDTEGCRQRRPEHGATDIRKLLWDNSPLLRSLPQPEVAAVVDLLLSMLTLDPGTRATAAAALRHPWLREMAPPPSADSVYAAGRQGGRQAPAYPQRALRPCQQQQQQQQQPC